MGSAPAPQLPADRRRLRHRLARPQPGDVAAGLAVALVLIPQAVAYAELAGMPPERGLFAAALPLIVAAPLASSPYLQIGPVAITSVLTFGALTPLATPGSDRYIGLGLLLAVLVGAVRIAIGLTRTGEIAYLMSRPMLVGFVPAATAYITASQLPRAFGVAPSDAGVLEHALATLAAPGTWSLAALAMSLGVVAVVLGARRLHPLAPGVLVAVVAATAVGALAGYGGPAVGRVEVSAPPLSLNLPWSEVGSLLVPAAIIALVGFAEPAAIARDLAARDRIPWDADAEFVSLGAANVASGISGGFPVGGSFGRSALNRLAGARTAWSGGVTGLAVLAILPAMGVMAHVPTAVLAAVVLTAVVPLIDVRPIVRMWRTSRPATLIAVGTLVATLGFAPRIERGVLVGVGLSIAVHLWRELRLECESWPEGAALHVRPQGVLWFGDAHRLDEQLLAVVAEHPHARRLVLHLDRVGRLDITAAEALREVLTQARSAGIEVEVTDVQARDLRLVDGVVLAPANPLR